MSFSANTGLASAQGSALAAAVDWVQDVFLGQVGTALAVLAVAAIGFRMLQGSYPLRDGVRVVLGCFILFGSAVIARGMMGITAEPGSVAEVAPRSLPAPVYATPSQQDSSSNPFDPYTGHPGQN